MKCASLSILSLFSWRMELACVSMSRALAVWPVAW